MLSLITHPIPFLNGSHHFLVYMIPLLTLASIVCLYLLRWRDYYLPYHLYKKQTEDHLTDQTDSEQGPSTGYPKLSVIVPTHDQADLLRRLIPALLEQDYPQYEVIVVDEASDDETVALIENFQTTHSNLRMTFVPKSATNICRRKLSVTLGFRAARSEWVVVLSASSMPASRYWLKNIAACIDDGCDIVLGYANYTDDGSHYGKKAIFERLRQQMGYYRSALSKGAIGAEETNFCIRKDYFLENKGYADNLQINLGEGYLLVAKLSQRDNTRLALSPDGIIREELPDKTVLEGTRVSYREILHYANRRSRSYLWKEGTASTFNYLLFLLYVSYFLTRISLFIEGGLNTANYFIMDGVVLLSIVAVFILPAYLLGKTTKMFGEPRLTFILCLNAFTQPFSNFLLKMARWRRNEEFEHRH